MRGRGAQWLALAPQGLLQMPRTPSLFLCCHGSQDTGTLVTSGFWSHLKQPQHIPMFYLPSRGLNGAAQGRADLALSCPMGLPSIALSPFLCRLSTPDICPKTGQEDDLTWLVSAPELTQGNNSVWHLTSYREREHVDLISSQRCHYCVISRMGDTVCMGCL